MFNICCSLYTFGQISSLMSRWPRFISPHSVSCLCNCFLCCRDIYLCIIPVMPIPRIISWAVGILPTCPGLWSVWALTSSSVRKVQSYYLKASDASSWPQCRVVDMDQVPFFYMWNPVFLALLLRRQSFLQSLFFISLSRTKISHAFIRTWAKGQEMLASQKTKQR